MKKASITWDTILLTVISLGLQGLSLLLNIFITRRLGTTSVGITSLIFSFYSFIIILANGNIFTSTSRFVSEEIGKNGDVNKIVGYALKFGLILSISFAVVIFIFARLIAENFLRSEYMISIRLLALSLPLATIGSCLKGYYHAKRSIIIPCIADTMEFLVKGIIVFICVGWIIPAGKIDIFNAIALSVVAGEVVSCLFLSVTYGDKKNKEYGHLKPSIHGFRQYIISILPIVLSGYTFVILSGANEALVPFTLKKFSGSTDIALSEYGIFEAIILPIIFFPATILSSLSCILIPEIARENSAQNMKKVGLLTEKVLHKGLTYAILVASILLCKGGEIGAIACSDSLVSRTLLILCPVIPFIYLEILMEGILKGLGKQNFSTINSAIEYILRIASVVIFVPQIGFNGIIVSYFVSNIVCNIIRIVAVLKATKLRFNVKKLLLEPIFAATFAFFITHLILKFIPQIHPTVTLICDIIIASVTYFAVLLILGEKNNIKFLKLLPFKSEIVYNERVRKFYAKFK